MGSLEEIVPVESPHTRQCFVTACFPFPTTLYEFASLVGFGCQPNDAQVPAAKGSVAAQTLVASWPVPRCQAGRVS